LELGFVLVYVNDVAATVRFYEEVLGLKKRFSIDTADGGYAEFGTPTGGVGIDAGSVRLVFSTIAEAQKLFGHEFKDSLTASPGGAIQLRFVHDDEQSVATCYQAAISAGATAVTEPAVQPWGSVLARFRDPNGLLVSIVSRLSAKEQARRWDRLGGSKATQSLMTATERAS
jgi:catechol 2,3-dioxygenase-like lactoylglutathione lyase family enzyme